MASEAQKRSKAMNLEVSVEDGIARVHLNNPPLNLLTNVVKQEIKDTFLMLSRDKTVRVILFEAAGNHFCCGANLKEFPDRINNDMAKEAWIEGHDMLRAIMNAPQPTIVCAKGNVLGGGAELASAFDIRLFAENVAFGYPEISRTVFPGNGGFERFMQLAGEANAPYLFLTGSKITAEESLRLGLANKLIKKEELVLEGRKTAQLIASYSQIAITTIKQSIISFRDNDHFFSKGMNDFQSLHKTEDIRESINAFFEKRHPIYQHK
jgi:enoyl-CoA hydratase/carnithine racemase